MTDRTAIVLLCFCLAAGARAPSYAGSKDSAAAVKPVLARLSWPPPLETISADGEKLFSVMRTTEAVLYSTEPDGSPKGAGPNKRIRWYLMTHMLSKDPRAHEKQLEKPIFQEPPASSGAGDFPFPSEPIHLGNSPVDTAHAKGKTLLMFTPESGDRKGPQPRRARGVFAHIGVRAKSTEWFCLTPALWWGDGVTEEMVRAGCKSRTPSGHWGWNFSFTCDGAAAAEPDCVGYNQRKKQSQKLPAPQP